jgi:CRP-like cAMP-binding protein
MRRSSETLHKIRAHPLLGKLSRANSERLRTYAKQRTFRRGAIIFRKGDAGAELVAVLSGIVKISTPGPDGREVILNMIQAGEVFGEIALLDHQGRSADAIAATDCELLFIHRRDVNALLRAQPDLALKLSEVACARLRQTSEQVEDAFFLDLRARLAKALLRLCEQAGGSRPARIELTQQELSQRIGMSREATNKQLRRWAKAGLIELDRAAIVVLMPDALAKAAQRR